MRTSSIDRGRQAASVYAGLVSSVAARSYSWIEEVQNDTGADIPEGSVVAVRTDGTIELSDIENDPRPTGVVIDTIDDGDTGQVCFGGPVDLVQVTASVTAGQYGQSSTTPGEAQVAGSASTAFCMFTDSGTTPSAFLWGGRGGGGVGIGTGTAAAEPTFDHGNMGSTETIDLADGTWHRGTLDADCTITVTGFTVDEGLVCVFECDMDGTGGWGITWDPDVVFIGDDQPDTTAGAVTVFLLFSSAGDSLIYGAKVGGSTVAALDDLTDVTLTTPATADRLRFDGSVWRNSALKWSPTTTFDGTNWLLVVDGGGNPVLTEV